MADCVEGCRRVETAVNSITSAAFLGSKMEPWQEQTNVLALLPHVHRAGLVRADRRIGNDAVSGARPRLVGQRGGVEPRQDHQIEAAVAARTVPSGAIG
jgi:hypothetical protein